MSLHDSWCREMGWPFEGCDQKFLLPQARTNWCWDTLLVSRSSLGMAGVPSVVTWDWCRDQKAPLWSEVVS